MPLRLHHMLWGEELKSDMCSAFLQDRRTLWHHARGRCVGDVEDDRVCEVLEGEGCVCQRQACGCLQSPKPGGCCMPSSISALQTLRFTVSMPALH